MEELEKEISPTNSSRGKHNNINYSQGYSSKYSQSKKESNS